ncbi:MAG: cobalamin-binding protein [Gammaproteobacteria bacterium]|nr:cobalamin-binding protein [Gammaproteobacteria bacterium]
MRAGLASLILSSLICLAACSENTQPTAAEAAYSRVVTLAPNLTELVYAVGAGATLVGVSAYSDYPAEALSLPIVGDAFMIDQERLAMLQPDLLLAWQSGTPAHVVDELRRVGYTVEVVRTQSLQDVAEALRRIGALTGFSHSADVVASNYLKELQFIREQFAAAADISVFYQVSRRPLFTVNGAHYVSELVDLCGGQNVFSDLNSLAPAIDVEAVVARDPEVILASSDAGEEAFAEWQRWPHLGANRYGNHFMLPADVIGRATPRLLIAAQAVCTALSAARENRMASAK